MSTQRMGSLLGWRIYGLGIMALALVSLVWGDFDPGQPVPPAFPGRQAWAYGVGVFLLISGALIESRRWLAWGAAALSLYYVFVVVIVMNGPPILAHPTVFGVYSGAAEQVAIAAGALMLYAAIARIDAGAALALTRIARALFGLCAVLFGGAHFFYRDLTVPLVPKWLPPTQVFWAYATGVAHIAAGLAILTGVRSRLAAILLTVMYASFTPLVHLPMLLADPRSHWIWAENALNLLLTGVAWVTADALRGAIPVRLRAGTGRSASLKVRARAP